VTSSNIAPSNTKQLLKILVWKSQAKKKTEWG